MFDRFGFVHFSSGITRAYLDLDWQPLAQVRELLAESKFYCECVGSPLPSARYRYFEPYLRLAWPTADSK